MVEAGGQEVDEGIDAGDDDDELDEVVGESNEAPLLEAFVALIIEGFERVADFAKESLKEHGGGVIS